jgi:hypothetical protein
MGGPFGSENQVNASPSDIDPQRLVGNEIREAAVICVARDCLANRQRVLLGGGWQESGLRPS